METEIPTDEQDRLVALAQLGILDTCAEDGYDRLTHLAARALDTPVALFNLIDADRQWSKSSFGANIVELPRWASFCSHTILSEGTLVVSDATLDPRFADLPSVTGSPGVRFYAGRPVHSPSGQRVGTVCVMDFQPRALTSEQIGALEEIASLVELELSRSELTSVLDANRRLERRFAAVIGRSTEALMLVEREGTPAYARGALNRLLGYPPGTVTRSNYLEYVHPDDRALVEKVMSPIDEDHGPGSTNGSDLPEHLEVRLRAPDGSWRWMDVRVHVLADDTPADALVISARDVTDYLDFSAAQRKANARLDAALRVAQNGFMEFDTAGNVVDANSVVRNALAVRNMGTDDFWDLHQFAVDAAGRPFPPDYQPIADAITKGRHLKGEIIGLRPERSGGDGILGIPPERSDPGDVRWFSINTAPLMVGDEQHTIMSVHDVTSARVLETELARQHRRYELIFEHASDVLAVVDIEGRVLFSSPSTERVLGQPLDERTPGGVLSLVHPDDRNIVRDTFSKVMLNKWDAEERVVVRTATTSGEWVYLEATATNLLLEPSINGILISARDVTSRELLTQALAHQAMRDPLTGLFNRRAFGEGLERALARAARSGGNVGLLWLDLDGFKSINDSYGHAVGDAVLVEVARRLSSTIRAGDVVGRFGGDEFVIVLEPITEPDHASAMAKRVLSVISKPFMVKGLEITCPPSIGLVLSHGERDPDLLLARADTAMYQAKRAGGEQIALG